MKNRTLLSSSLIFATLIALLIGCKVVNSKLQGQEVSLSMPMADIDWDILEKAKVMFPTEEAYNAYKKLPLLELKMFEDNACLRKMKLSESFYMKYPDDYRQDKARHLFISANPLFISKTISDSLKQILGSIPRKESRRFMNLLPIDSMAMSQWLHRGNAMVAEVLASDRAIEDKEEAEWSLFGRDFVKGVYNFSFHLNETKVGNANYWESFQLRLKTHIVKYAELPIVADRATDFLSSLKVFAPELAKASWRELLLMDTNSKKLGFKALHNMAKKQLGALVVESGDKPLDMSFTAIDGTTVDLAKLRGKVVLVDFWASWCTPCVKEIPHLKELYDKYHTKGFEIIGITLDGKEAEETVNSIIESKKILWPQRFEGVGFHDDNYRQLYGIGSLPTVWLVSKEGIIVDRNARGERLEPLLRKGLGLAAEK